MNIKPYSYKKARKSTDMFRVKSEYHLWMANEMLKKAIKRSCLSGLDYADIELTLYTSGFNFDDVNQIEVTIKDLADIYFNEGYYTNIKELMGTEFKIEGYRLRINW